MPAPYDVIVIGSGPAGCAAAISCHMQGLNTVIVTCGEVVMADETIARPWESIHPGVATLLSQLNAAHCINTAIQGGYEGIEANGQYNALGEDENGAWQGYHIDRTLFDAALLQCAIQQGVAVLRETVAELIIHSERITGVITKEGTKVSGTYTIDASGHKRIAGRQLDFKENFYSPPLVTWTGVCEDIPPNHPLFQKKAACFIPHSTGWTWIAPGMHGRCAWTRLEIKGKQELLPPAQLQEYPLIGDIKAANRRWRVFRPVCREGLILCGDAAGIIDPASGQGILNALHSALMAAKTIKACIAQPNFEALHLARYNEWYMNNYLDKVQKLKQFYQLHGMSILDNATH